MARIFAAPRSRLFSGEILLASKLSSFGDKVTLVQKLGENARAMAIKVDAVTAVGGFVTPGDYVDIDMTQGSKQDHEGGHDPAKHSCHRG